MIILDTDILVDILREKERGKEWIEFLRSKSITFTTISAYELFFGAELSRHKEENLKQIQRLVKKYRVLPFSVKSSFIAAKIQAELQKNGTIIDIRDLYIASIAIEHNVPLATNNVKHFGRIRGLKFSLLNGN